jgi:hypothetical protein
MQYNHYDMPAAYGYAAPGQRGAAPSPLDVLHAHEQRRRRALLRVISLGVLVPVVLLIPTALIPTLDKITLIALIIAFIGTLAAFLLNQIEQVGAGSFALLAGLSAAVAWEIIAKAQAQHGIDLSDLRLYDLFILPIVVSAVLIGRRGPIIFGVAAAAFTIISLLTLPHTPELQLYWDGHYKDATLGSFYDVIAVPIAIQLLAAIAAWLGADSVRKALLEASRADDLAAANAQIQEQTRALELQRYRLQQGIGQLQAVHTAVTRGQWDARASISDGELLPVALSLNLLLDRISRISREGDQRARVDAASHELAIALRRLRAGGPYAPPNYTGTPFDEVLVELARLRALPAPNAARVTGLSLGGPSQMPRSLPAPASQPERPFPFGPAAPRHDPAAFATPPSSASPRFDPAAWANPPSNIPTTGPFASPRAPLLQAGRMSLPPLHDQAQQPNNPAFDNPPFDGPAFESRVTESPTFNGPHFNGPVVDDRAADGPSFNNPNVPPPSGPLASPGDARPPLPTVPRGSLQTGRPDAPDGWPDLALGPAPERGPVSTALPAWLQAQAASAPASMPATPGSAAPNSPTDGLPDDGPLADDGFSLRALSTGGPTANGPAEPIQLSASDLIQPADLPPWLRETTGTGDQAGPPPPTEDDATASNLPPWLQNIQ